MDSVLELRSGLVVLRRGAERSTILVSSGILGYAFDKIQVCVAHWPVYKSPSGPRAACLTSVLPSTYHQCSDDLLGAISKVLIVVV